MCRNTPIVVLAFNVSGNEGDFMRLHEYAIQLKNALCEDIKFELYTNLHLRDCLSYKMSTLLW